MPYSPREIAEQVRKMVAGEGVVFADLFAADGVLAYPFAPRGSLRSCGAAKPSAPSSPRWASRGSCSTARHLPRPVATRLGGDTLDPRHNGLI
jgi:hypothetical protein